MSTTITATVAVIETMPEYLRSSHEAAGNWGRYPHNGSERQVVPSDEVSDHVADGDEYDHVVCRYTATIDADGVSIYDAEGHQAGTGKWVGSISDCSADLGDDVYEALDAALLAAGARTRNKDSDAPYVLEVYSQEWGGYLVNGWTPAIAGTLNQVCPTISDLEASTYPTLAKAMADLDCVREQNPERIRIMNRRGVEVFEEDCGEDEEDIDDCYIMTCASGAVVLVSAESAEQAEETWDADDAERRVTSARQATQEDVDACVDSGHDYR